MLYKISFQFFIAITAVSLLPHNVPPSDDYLPSQARIEGGTPITAATYAPCYTTIVVFLTNVTRICGGCVISPGNKILTAASCILSTYQNATAANMIFSFGILYVPLLWYRMTNIAIPSGYNVSLNTSSNDVAVVTLNLNVTSSVPNMKVSNLSSVATKDAFLGENLIACGFGVKNNLGIRPVFLNCVTLTVVSTDTCFSSSSTTIAATCTTASSSTSTTSSTTASTTTSTASSTATFSATDSTTTSTSTASTTTPAPTTTSTTTIATISPAGVICTKNTDGHGVCYNDEGSPVFSNSTGTLIQVGVISYVANRNSSYCGTLVVITQVGSFRSFINSA
ncbi:hypothetical protein PVAND_014568 [Polypedilum vanderplanki]|uniref:Peptidase S1 domain-containing protein n=1 Tax=Polypedilum vanderplanki TaxID=319348 RepID=A0A9J6BAB4_POLVA|nr:hypothetical protein PVAND_014568 [Polypedilum vanderplanki]